MELKILVLSEISKAENDNRNIMFSLSYLECRPNKTKNDSSIKWLVGRDSL
jgi:hypothetical protein